MSYTVLRPTLLFGWFERKHLGWVSQFMSASSIFPIFGHGNYVRKPLYAGDFSEIIIACIRTLPPSQSYNISGKEKITRIEINRKIKVAIDSGCLLSKLPYTVFHFLLSVYAIVDRDPPFTTAQLQVLLIDEVFEDTDWEAIFNVRATPLDHAIHDTFTHPVYSKIKLKL